MNHNLAAVLNNYNYVDFSESLWAEKACGAKCLLTSEDTTGPDKTKEYWLSRSPTSFTAGMGWISWRL